MNETRETNENKLVQRRNVLERAWESIISHGIRSLKPHRQDLFRKYKTYFILFDYYDIVLSIFYIFRNTIEEYKLYFIWRAHFGARSI